MATLEEIEAEIARREGKPIGESIVSSAKAALAGAESGATGLLGFVPEMIALPGNIGRVGLQDKQPISPTAEARKFFQIPEEPKTGAEQFMYRFAEGATPAAAMASPSFLAGPVVGGIATGTAGLVGGLSNVAAKGLFPESPTGQMLVGFMPGLFGSIAGRVRRNVPETAKPSVSEETNIPMTAGQRTGSEALLREEAAVSKTTGGAPIFQRFGLNQANTAEDFASKIQQFSAKTDLPATDISKGVIDAVNYQNNRLVNKFRAQNRVNFGEAKKVAGDEPIFGTDNLNSVLDNQIALYSSDKMPVELRAVADNLSKLKNTMTKKAEPSMILNEQGQPAVTIPEQTQKLTIDELQKNLESWGKAAKTGEFSLPGGTDNVFKGVAPGTVKGIARQVLNGFKGDLDAAASSNIKGATELQKARNAFRDGLQELDAYAETPFIKTFMKDNETALDATKAVDILKNVTPTERTVMVKLLENNRPDIVASVRNQQVADLIEANKGDTAGLLKGFKEVLKTKSEKGAIGLNDFLFPTAKEKAQTAMLVRDLESISKKPVGAAEDFTSQMRGITTDAAAVGGGWTVAKAVSVVQDVMNGVSGSANSAEKLAWMMTSPQGKDVLRYLANQKVTNKPLPQTLADSLNFLGKYSAIGAVPTARQGDLSMPEQIDMNALEQRIKELESQQ